MKIFINPGHMPGVDSGAVNPDNDMQECDYTKKIGELATFYLQLAGEEVYCLQSDNLLGESPAYPCIVRSANDWGADIFVSIHCNAGGGRGAETLIYSMGGEREILAQAVQDRLVRSIKAIDPAFPDRGLKERTGLAVLRGTNMPAILVETAFIDNQQDAWLLYNYADSFARAIACGVTDYENTLTSSKAG